MQLMSLYTARIPYNTVLLVLGRSAHIPVPITPRPVY